MSLVGTAQTFSSSYFNGQSLQVLWYSITSDSTVELTSPSDGAYLSTFALQGNFEIPSSVLYNGVNYRVTGIHGVSGSALGGVFSFVGCNSDVDTVVIPSSFRYVGANAFYGSAYCSGVLTDQFHAIVIGDSVETIGDQAFLEMGWHSYTKLGKAVRYIGERAFGHASSGEDPVHEKHIEYSGSVEEWLDYWNTIVTNSPASGLESLLFRASIYLYGVKLNDASILGRQHVTANSLKYYGLHSAVLGPHVVNVDPNAFANTRFLVARGTTAGAPWGAKHWGTEMDYGTGLFYNDTSRTLLFGGKSTVTAIDVPATVRTIGEEAFMDYDSLLTLTLNEGLDSIGPKAFANCTALDTVYIPRSVRAIGDSAFLNVRHVVYYSGLEGAPWGAMSADTMVDYHVTFSNKCSGTTYRLVSARKSTFSDAQGRTFSAEVSEGGRLTVADHCDGTVTLTATPDSGYTFMFWGDHAEQRDSTNPRTVSIDSLPQVMAVFMSDQGGDSLHFPYPCRDGQILWYSVTSDSTAEVTYGSLHAGFVTAYEGLNGNIYIPGRVVYNGVSYRVDGICGHLPLYGAFSFAHAGNCWVDTVFLPNSMTYISDAAFCAMSVWGKYFDSFHGVVIGDSVISIGSLAFTDNKHLGYVKLGKSVKYIWDRAFYSCDGLDKVVYNGTLLEWLNQWNIIASNDSTRTDPLVVEYGAGEGSQSLFFPGTSQFININAAHTYLYLPNEWNNGYYKVRDIVIPEEITSIQNHIKHYGHTLISVVAPQSVANIDSNAFANVRNLVTLGTTAGAPWGAKRWGTDWDPSTGLFYNNSSRTLLFGGKSTVTAIDVPTTVRTIGEEAFMGYDGLLTLTLNDSLDSIGPRAFADCRAVDTVFIPDSVSFIGEDAFRDVNYIYYHGNATGAPWGALRMNDGEQAIVSAVVDSTLGYVTGLGLYEVGATVTVRAYPTDSAYFVMWDDSVTTNPRSITLMQNVTLQPVFALLPYYAVHCDSTMGYIEGGNCRIPKNTYFEVLAVPYDDYYFLYWQNGNDTLYPIQRNPMGFYWRDMATGEGSVIADKSYTAHFALKPLLTVACDSTQGIVDGGGRYAPGATATITATGLEPYVFDRWSDGNTDNPRTVTMGQGDTTFTALFVHGLHVATPHDTAIGTVDGGGWYLYGRSATLTATAAEGWHFVRWSDGVATNPRTFTVMQDTTFTAYFMEDNPRLLHCTFEHPLDAERWTLLNNSSLENTWAVGALDSTAGHALFVSNDGGATNTYTLTQATSIFTYTTLTLDTGVYKCLFDWRCSGDGSNDYLRAALLPESIAIAAGTSASGWTSYSLPSGAISLDGGKKNLSNGEWRTQSAVAHITTPGRYRIVFYWRNNASDGTQPPAAVDNVIFTDNLNMVVDAKSNNSDWGYVTGGGDYYYGDTATLVAHAYEGFHFLRWSTNETTDTLLLPVDGDKTITAIFVADSVMQLVDIVGQGSVSGTGLYVWGDTAMLVATAAEGWQFDHWSADSWSTLYFNDTLRVVQNSTSATEFTVKAHFATVATASTASNGQVYDFETSDDDSQWVLLNVDRTNRWTIGDAAGHPGRAIYISDNGGDSNRYTNGQAATIFAYTYLTLDSGMYRYDYDWRCMGHFSTYPYDFLKVVLLPLSVTTQAGTSTTDWSYGMVPEEAISLDDGHALLMSGEWRHQGGVVTVPEAGVYKLALRWRNSTTTGIQPPAAVDNISLVPYPSVLHDTTEVELHDTTLVVDTLVQRDTTTVTLYEAVHDTTLVVDTLVLRDTSTVTLYEAVHDTTLVVDTLVLHDTTTVTLYEAVHDTMLVVDTLMLHDTATVTLYEAVHDTTLVVDTLTLHDTTIVADYVTVRDTTWVYDTVWVADTTVLHDTVTVDRYWRDTIYVSDTVWVHDTVYIHDTILIESSKMRGGRWDDVGYPPGERQIMVRRSTNSASGKLRKEDEQ